MFEFGLYWINPTSGGVYADGFCTRVDMLITAPVLPATSSYFTSTSTRSSIDPLTAVGEDLKPTDATTLGYDSSS